MGWYLKKDSDICFLDLSIIYSVQYTFSWAKDKQFQVVEMWPPKWKDCLNLGKRKERALHVSSVLF